MNNAFTYPYWGFRRCFYILSVPCVTDSSKTMRFHQIVVFLFVVTETTLPLLLYQIDQQKKTRFTF